MNARKALVVILWKHASGDRRVLLLKLVEKRGGFWQPVTGKVEEGESFAEGALREAEEETGFRFAHHPQYLGLEYSFTGRHGPATERAYLLSVGGEEPPTPTLDPKEHTDFQWRAPAEAIPLLKYETNQRAVERATLGNPPLFLSRTGAFFQEGEEITHARTAELLHRSLTQEGALFVVKQGAETLDVVVEDTPRFVAAYDNASGTLRLVTGEQEVLDPTSLRFRSDHSVTCRLKNGWEARLLSPAYYALMGDVREEGSEYVLHFLGHDHRLPVSL